MICLVEYFITYCGYCVYVAFLKGKVMMRKSDNLGLENFLDDVFKEMRLFPLGKDLFNGEDPESFLDPEDCVVFWVIHDYYHSNEDSKSCAAEIFDMEFWPLFQ